MPTYPSLTLSFEDRLTDHLQEIEARLNGQAWPRMPLLDFLLKNAQPYKGGEYITEIIEDNYTPTGDAIGEGSTIPATQKNIMEPAMYPPRAMAESCYLDGFRRDKIMTQGSMGPVLNWVQEQVDSTGRMARENLATHICAAATGTAADGSTRFQSIFDIVKTSGTVGGISATTSTWWAAQGTATITWSSTGPATLRTYLRKARRYKGFAGPNAFFVSATTIDAMKAGGYTKTTYFRAPDDRPNKQLDVGDNEWTWSAQDSEPDAYFDNIPVYYDPHLDALESSALSTGGVLLGLNSKAVYLRLKPGMLFRMEPWQKSQDKYGSFTRLLTMGELVACNRSSNVIITSIS